MNYLLDTHVVIWSITDDQENLGALRNEIKDLENNCFVSIASLWEIAIKHHLNKIELRGSLKEVFRSVEASSFKIQQINTDHILATASLEHHHRDPFDRLLIAQAITENFTIITRDKLFASYPVNVKWN